MATTSDVRLPAEWEPQDGVMVAWPHAGTDWAYMLDEVTTCYQDLCRAIECDDEKLLVVNHVPTDDTWIRDYGPITVLRNGAPVMLDFKYNAWGMKFAASNDNMVNRRLADEGKLFAACLESHQDMVLEGGSIESDGAGTIMVTSRCLLEPNRNGAWNRQRIEEELCYRLGARKVLWLDHGDVPGDDTDGHIDTLARFAPDGVILYIADHDDTGTYPELTRMKEQLGTFTSADGAPYRLLELPLPHHIVDSEGHQLPATYANFLVMNHQVLVPTYGQSPTDQKAMDIIGQAFPTRRIVGVDCRALIEQHGSLHCATMQLPRGTLKNK